MTFLMEITEFFEFSIGRSRSQHSAHHLAFASLEQVHYSIEPLSVNKSAVLEICLDKSR
jgi:phycoerythrin-associated linker protein